MAGNQAVRLQERYERDGQPADLDTAIDLGGRALDATGRGSPGWAGMAGNQAVRLQERYERDGQPADLDTAIDLGGRALDATGQGSPGWAGMAGNQANRLQARYDRDGDRQDLDAAIELGHAVLQATPRESPVWAARMSNHASALRRRYELVGDRRDLDAAVERGQQALDATAPGSPSWAGYANSVAIGLGDRYARDGDQADLDAAIDFGQQALAATAAGSPSWATYAYNLANLLLDRHALHGARTDLDDAIRFGQWALDATAAGSTNWAGRAVGQAARLRERLAWDAGAGGLDDVISLSQKALDATPMTSPDWPMYANSVAIGLGDRYARDGDQADLDAAIRLGQRALAATGAGSPHRAIYVRNQAGRLWVAGDRRGAVGLWRSVLGGMPVGGDVDSRIALNVWLDTVASDAVWWASGAEALVGLVGVADGAVTAGDSMAGSWGPWCAGWLVEVAQALEEGRLDASAGLDEVWFNGVCDRLDPEGAGLDAVTRAVRAGVVACEATRARWLSRVMWSRRTELGQLREVKPALANRFVALTEELAKLELAGKRAGSTSAGSDGLAGAEATGLGQGEMWVPGGVVSRRQALQTELDWVLGEIRGVPGFARFAGVPVFAELAAAVPAGGLVVVPVAAGHDHGWLLTLHRAEAEVELEEQQAGVEGEASDESRSDGGGVSVGMVPMPAGVDFDVLVSVAELWAQAVGLVGKRDVDRSREDAAQAVGLQVMTAVLGWCWQALVAPVQAGLAGRPTPRRVWWIPNGPLSGLPVGVAPAGIDDPTTDDLTSAAPTSSLNVAPGVDDADGPSPGGDRDSGDGFDPQTGGGSGWRGRVLLYGLDPKQVEQWADRILAGLSLNSGAAGALVGVPVSRMVALSLLDPHRTPAPAVTSGGVVSVGVRQVGPPRDKDLEVLAEAEVEARKVAGVHRQAGIQQVSELLGADAGVQQVTRALRDHPVVHLSCHGTLDPADPGASALELHDAALRLDEVVGWDVSGVLAVLSACRSNAPGIQADEHLSLAAAVQLAGYAHVIGSLDPVPVTKTAKLMRRLHDQLVDGADPATALHSVRAWARHRWPNQPHIWATWTHTGP
jgi:hypothetical protein